MRPLSKFHYSYVYITSPVDTLENREDVDMEIERNPVLDFDTENAVDPLLRETYAALASGRGGPYSALMSC